MQKLKQSFLVFLIGGFGYYNLEVIFRGFSHWSMFVAGGLALVSLLYLFCSPISIPFGVRCILGCGIITAIELIIGLIVNKLLGWNVWDYSSMPYNLWGQISLPFSFIWLVLCIPLGKYMEYVQEKLHIV